MQTAKIADHWKQDCYDGFRLTEAVRPAPEMNLVPREGYRVETFRDARDRHRIPMLAAAVSRERLFSIFLDLVEPLGAVVDVILETSHDSQNGKHRDLCREGIDTPVFLSHLFEHEDLMLNDGCTGVAVLNEEATMEVQFDEHKLLIVYAYDLEPFERILEAAGICRDEQLPLITEAEHLHSTHPKYRAEFEQLCYHLGIEEAVEPVNW